MKKITYLCLLLITTGCQAETDKLKKAIIPTTQCSKQPTQELTANNIREIVPSEESMLESGQLKEGQTIGYTFDGDADQLFNYKINEDICAWLIAPDTQVVTGDRLPIGGKYIIQLSPKKAASDFKLEFSSEISQKNFNQDRALDLVKQWYAAKPQIFSSPFDAEIVSKLATGELYNRVLVENQGGSVGWLKQNDCYYQFYYSQVNKVISFSNTEERPALTVSVSEKLELNGPSSAGCGRGAKSYIKYVTYWFEKDGKYWKIYDYKIGS
jgi:hypothetical protein